MHRRLLPAPQILLTTTLMIFVMGCESFGSFHFTEESEPIRIQGRSDVLNNGVLADLFPTTIPMEIDLEQQLEEQNATGARGVYLSEIYFELTDDSDAANFDFIDRITIQANSDSHPRRDLAWIDPVPEGEGIFYLDVDDGFDLKPYAEEGLRLRTNAAGSAPSQDVEFRVIARFRVEVL